MVVCDQSVSFSVNAAVTTISFEAFRSCGRTLPHVCAQSDVTTWGPKGKRKREEGRS